MHARDDLANTCFNTCLLSEFCDVLPCPADDYSGILCAYKSTKGENVISRRCRGAGVRGRDCSKIAGEKGGEQAGKNWSIRKMINVQESGFAAASEDIVEIIWRKGMEKGGGREEGVADGVKAQRSWWSKSSEHKTRQTQSQRSRVTPAHSHTSSVTSRTRLARSCHVSSLF